MQPIERPGSDARHFFFFVKPHGALPVSGHIQINLHLISRAIVLKCHLNIHAAVLPPV